MSDGYAPSTSLEETLGTLVVAGAEELELIYCVLGCCITRFKHSRAVSVVVQATPVWRRAS